MYVNFCNKTPIFCIIFRIRPVMLVEGFTKKLTPQPKAPNVGILRSALEEPSWQ